MLNHINEVKSEQSISKQFFNQSFIVTVPDLINNPEEDLDMWGGSEIDEDMEIWDDSYSDEPKEPEKVLSLIYNEKNINPVMTQQLNRLRKQMFDEVKMKLLDYKIIEAINIVSVYIQNAENARP